MELIDLGFDIFNEIFSWLTSTRDIINVSHVCHEFYNAIWPSIVVIDFASKINIPFNWLCKFKHLTAIEPRITIKSKEDLFSLANKLVYASFDLPFTINCPEQHLVVAAEFLRLQKIKFPYGKFYFGHSNHANHHLDIHLTHQLLCYVGDSLIGLYKVIWDFPYIVSSCFTTFLPDSVREFTYIMCDEFPAIPKLDIYLERRYFGMVVNDLDIQHNPVHNYLRFARLFRNLYTKERKFPLLRELDIPLQHETLHDLLEDKTFPNLELVGITIDSIKEEKTIKEFLLNNAYRLPRNIILYSFREDIRYRSSQWQINNLTIESRYPIGIVTVYERYVSL